MYLLTTVRGAFGTMEDYDLGPQAWYAFWKGNRTPYLQENPKVGEIPVWVVVSNIFHFHPYLGKMNPFLTNIFFQKGLVQPPTSHSLIGFCLPKTCNSDQRQTLRWFG